MSDKTLVMEALQRLPEDVTIVDIRKEIDFIVAVKSGREQIQRGEIISLNEVEKKIQAWATK